MASRSICCKPRASALRKTPEKSIPCRRMQESGAGIDVRPVERALAKKQSGPDTGMSGPYC
jgi:hypothetical protein